MKNKKLSCILASLVILLFSSVSLAAVPIDVTVGKEVVVTLDTAARVNTRISIGDCNIADIKSICGETSRGNLKCIRVMKEKCEVEKCEKEKCGAAGDLKNITSISKVVVNGKQPGVTSLIIWYRDKESNKEKESFYDVIVEPQISRIYEEKLLDDLAGKIRENVPGEDITVEKIGDTIVLKGSVKNGHIIKKIENIALLYAQKGCSGVKRDCSLPMGCELDKKEEGEIEGGVSVQVVPQQGQQKISLTKEQSEDSLCVLNLLTMPDAQQVVLEVKVAQINKTKLKQLGISYLLKDKNIEFTAPGLFSAPGGTLGAPATAGTTTTTTIGGITGTSTTGTVTPGIGPGLTGFDVGNISPQIGVAHFPSGVAAVLRALQEKGFGKILAEPNLAVRSGERGNFHVGQRIPIQTVTGTGGDATVGITYEDVGIRLNFAPQVLETGAIRLKLDPAEVSSVARFITFQGVIAPEIDTRTVNTSVDLRDGESLVLAGLLSEEMTKNIQKIPILGDIPILGALFRSSRDDLTQTEVVFFITPKLVKPTPKGIKTPLPTDKALTPEEEREFEWIPFPGSSKGPEGKSESGGAK